VGERAKYTVETEALPGQAGNIRLHAPGSGFVGILDRDKWEDLGQPVYVKVKLCFETGHRNLYETPRETTNEEHPWEVRCTCGWVYTSRSELESQQMMDTHLELQAVPV